MVGVQLFLFKKLSDLKEHTTANFAHLEKTCQEISKLITNKKNNSSVSFFSTKRVNLLDFVVYLMSFHQTRLLGQCHETWFLRPLISMFIPLYAA
jgi:hypothetical protein